MYKLYLCVQYVLKRPLAYFAMAGVTLCVLVMLICISILTGFINKIERAAKGLFGDVIVQSAGLSGIGHYDEFVRQMRAKVPAVEAASPFILTYGLLQYGPDFRRTVQIAGIRPAERAAVSDFEDGLFIQKGLRTPSFDPPVDRILRRLEEHRQYTSEILTRERARAAPRGGATPEKQALIARLSSALRFQEEAAKVFRRAGEDRREHQRISKDLAAALATGDDGRARDLEKELANLEKVMVRPPEDRVILGLGIPALTFRTDRGETIRILGPGHNVTLMLIPLGRSLGAGDITPNQRTFTIIDDCCTDVSHIDSEVVYVPFETLQKLNNMSAEESADEPGRIARPARCSMIHVKVRADLSRGRALEDVARQIDRVWAEFQSRHPDAADTDVRVETWRQMQSRLVNQMESQRVLMVIILGVVSVVAVLLIFVIMYVIVVQKTRDIGVLKAIGASSPGVGAIFVAYGAAIGLVGSILGTLGGVAFVRNINPIHDWVGRTFGFVVWNRETFMFEKIPDEVDAGTILAVAAAALIAAMLSSLAPAILAASKQPVEALRYE